MPINTRKDRSSTYRFYRDIRRNFDVDVQIGRLYPSILDHAVWDDDDDDVDFQNLFQQVMRSPLIDDAIATIHRFASRCLAADKLDAMVHAMSSVLSEYAELSKPIVDVLLFYGAELDRDDDDVSIHHGCRIGLVDVVQRCIEHGRSINTLDMVNTLQSGCISTINLVYGACGERYRLGDEKLDLAVVTVESLELMLSLNIIQRETHYSFSNIPSFSVLQWILDHDVMEHDDITRDVARNAAYRSGHYFDMLKYLIEQRHFTVPRDILIDVSSMHEPVINDFDVVDYLVYHGCDVNAVDDNHNSVMTLYPMLIRCWMDRGLVVQSNDANTLVVCVHQGMTVPVLEMMIDKYSLDVNAAAIFHGDNALHEACSRNNYDVVEMLIRHGADVNIRFDGVSTCDLTIDECIQLLLVQHGYKQ